MPLIVWEPSEGLNTGKRTLRKVKRVLHLSDKWAILLSKKSTRHHIHHYREAS